MPDSFGGGGGGGLFQILSGLFGNSGQPYGDYGREYNKYNNPFYQGGKQGLNNYQDWLNGQKDPSGFINKLMGDYKQSDWAKFSTNQGQNAVNNAASASGLLGSTPMAQQSQQMAQGIASQDMNQWLQHVLGINTQYGQGQQHLTDMGERVANNMGENMGGAAYGERVGRNTDNANIWSGVGSWLGL